MSNLVSNMFTGEAGAGAGAGAAAGTGSSSTDSAQPQAEGSTPLAPGFDQILNS